MVSEVITLENRLRALRIEKGLTMKQLGQMLNLAESTISQYETSKRNIDNATLIKFSDIFHVTTDYLLGKSNIPAFPPTISDFDGPLFIYLSPSKQLELYDVLSSSCAKKGCDEDSAISQNGIPVNFFPDLKTQKRRIVCLSDIIRVAFFLGVYDSVSTILSSPDYDDYLTPLQKRDLVNAGSCLRKGFDSHSYTPADEELLTAYLSLNCEGKEKIRSYASDLVQTGLYAKENPAASENAAG